MASWQKKTRRSEKFGTCAAGRSSDNQSRERRNNSPPTRAWQFKNGGPRRDGFAVTSGAAPSYSAARSNHKKPPPATERAGKGMCACFARWGLATSIRRYRGSATRTLRGLSLAGCISPPGFLWRLTERVAAPPPSLYTFQRTAAGSARDSRVVPFRRAFPDFSRFLGEASTSRHLLPAPAPPARATPPAAGSSSSGTTP